MCTHLDEKWRLELKFGGNNLIDTGEFRDYLRTLIA